MNLEAKIAVNVKVGIITSEDGSIVIAHCPHLRLSGFGNSEKEALEDFEKAVKIFVQFHLDNKNLHQRLSSLGWNIAQYNYATPPASWEIPTDLLKYSNFTGSVERNYEMAYA